MSIISPLATRARGSGAVLWAAAIKVRAPDEGINSFAGDNKKLE